MAVVLSCYIERRGDWWEAVCPNLNFAATGRSLLDAHERLGRRIEDHIKYVETLPPKDRLAFYERRAGLSASCGRALSAVLTALSSRPRKEAGGDRIVYTFDFAV